MNDIIEAIMKARAVAFNEAIEANTVLINKEFGKVIPFSFEGQEIPPMICGLKAYISKDVPEELGFLMLKSKANEKNLVEVVQGRWINWGKSGTPTYENYGTCSVCHEDAEICTEHRNYCPNCGARMDGE